MSDKRIRRITILSLVIITTGLIYFYVTPPTCKPITSRPFDTPTRHNHYSYFLRDAIEGNDTSAIRDIVGYLVANRDTDNDGLIGYGLFEAWDAFQDGSVNPANHEYVVSNALVLLEMTRAYHLPIWSDTEHEAIRNTIYEVVRDTNSSMWDERGHYQYSPAPTDAEHVLNASAVWIGTQQYILHTTDIGTDAERALWQERNTRAIMSLLYILDRTPISVYRVSHSILNDLDHQAAQLRYLEIYRDNGGWLPYGAQDAIDSLYAYQHGDSWYIRPDYNQCLVNTWHVDYTLYELAK